MPLWALRTLRDLHRDGLALGALLLWPVLYRALLRRVLAWPVFARFVLAGLVLPGFLWLTPLRTDGWLLLPGSGPLLFLLRATLPDGASVAVHERLAVFAKHEVLEVIPGIVGMRRIHGNSVDGRSG
ncbi:hypothetical protein BJP07_09355 [Corynebacterium sp. NML130628]|nr:hypothetical protein BJP07_09355 [Corynebacterium sp. NML130628]